MVGEDGLKKPALFSQPHNPMETGLFPPLFAPECHLFQLFARTMRTLSLIVLLLYPFWTGREANFEPAVPLLHGIDVSHYQQRINWDEVNDRHVLDFAFVKATEGHEYTDSLFCRNWDALSRLGIRRGAYHFFRSYGCGWDQAQHFLKTVEMKAGDLPPVLDFETSDGMPREIMVEEARIWLQVVEATLHVKPIIYTNQHFYEKYLAGVFDNYPFWIARYSNERPVLSTGKDWHFWQYSNEGCLDGIPSKTDLNVFAGPPALLDALCWTPKDSSLVKIEATAAP